MVHGMCDGIHHMLECIVHMLRCVNVSVTEYTHMCLSVLCIYPGVHMCVTANIHECTCTNVCLGTCVYIHRCVCSECTGPHLQGILIGKEQAIQNYKNLEP